MRYFKSLVLTHYDFTDKEGKKVQKTKYLVSLGEYGPVEVCGPLDNSLEILSEVEIELTYKDNKFRVVSVKN